VACNPAAEYTGAYLGPRAIVEMLGAQRRTREPGGTRLRIPDSKTEAAIREVRITPGLANVTWVISQVVHANSTMTMEVYAQLQQRVNRQHGMAFDPLLRPAKEQGAP
jgi:hypothetical protein